jgi:hypothetical protein
MDLARFLSILGSKSLFFSSAESMEDTLEGTFGDSSDVDTAYAKHLDDLQVKKMMYLSCWNVSDVESAALWNLYGNASVTIAIRSTWGRVTTALISRAYIVGGKVEYVNYPDVVIDPINIFNTYVYKRRNFEHEKEARLVYWSGGSHEDDLRTLPDGSAEQIPTEHLIRPGFQVKVDLPRLIESVRTAPGTAPWVVEVVRDAIVRYGYSFPVIESTLYDRPRT